MYVRVLLSLEEITEKNDKCECMTSWNLVSANNKKKAKKRRKRLGNNITGQWETSD